MHCKLYDMIGPICASDYEETTLLRGMKFSWQSTSWSKPSEEEGVRKVEEKGRLGNLLKEWSTTGAHTRQVGRKNAYCSHWPALLCRLTSYKIAEEYRDRRQDVAP